MLGIIAKFFSWVKSVMIQATDHFRKDVAEKDIAKWKTELLDPQDINGKDAHVMLALNRLAHIKLLRRMHAREMDHVH